MTSNLPVRKSSSRRTSIASLMALSCSQRLSSASFTCSAVSSLYFALKIMPLNILQLHYSGNRVEISIITGILWFRDSQPDKIRLLPLRCTHRPDCDWSTRWVHHIGFLVTQSSESLLLSNFLLSRPCAQVLQIMAPIYSDRNWRDDMLDWNTGIPSYTQILMS